MKIIQPIKAKIKRSSLVSMCMALVLSTLVLPFASASAATNVMINTGSTNEVRGWQADTGYSGGTTSYSGSGVDTTKAASPAPEEIYKSERYGNFSYLVRGLEAGKNYKLRLHFAEYFWNDAGKRVFDVDANGADLLKDFDILKTAGGKNVAITRDFTVKSSPSGRITINFATKVDNAKVSGIQLFDDTSAPTPVPKPDPTPDNIAPLTGQPPNTDASGKGWRLRPGVDYSQYACSDGTKDLGLRTHTITKFTYRMCSVDGLRVTSVIVPRVMALKRDAKAQGINLTVNSGVRTYEEQKALHDANCKSGVCKPATAQPGTSSHEFGVAVDWGLDGKSFCFPNGATCEGNKGYDFMMKNASNYGFYKISKEAWHFSLDAR